MLADALKDAGGEDRSTSPPPIVSSPPPIVSSSKTHPVDGPVLKTAEVFM